MDLIAAAVIDVMYTKNWIFLLFDSTITWPAKAKTNSSNDISIYTRPFNANTERWWFACTIGSSNNNRAVLGPMFTPLTTITMKLWDACRRKPLTLFMSGGVLILVNNFSVGKGIKTSIYLKAGKICGTSPGLTLIGAGGVMGERIPIRGHIYKNIDIYLCLATILLSLGFIPLAKAIVNLSH